MSTTTVQPVPEDQRRRPGPPPKVVEERIVQTVVKMETDIPLARQIRKMIRNSGLTINALAKAAGVPQPVLHRFDLGERQNIRLDTIDKLCRYFGVRLTEPKPRKQATKRKERPDVKKLS